MPKREEEILKLLTVAFFGLHWRDRWRLLPSDLSLQHLTPPHTQHPALRLPHLPERSFLKPTDWAHCRSQASADQLASEQGGLWQAEIPAKQTGQAGGRHSPSGCLWTALHGKVDGFCMAHPHGLCLRMALHGQTQVLPWLQAEAARHKMAGVRRASWHRPAKALGCPSLPVMASCTGGPPLRHGEEPLLFTEGPFWGDYV